MTTPHQHECRFYLIRHGSTENNLVRPQRIQGRGIDSPLADVGHEEAAAVAKFFARRKLDHVYASPLVRARQTAEAVAEPHGLKVETVDELTEADVGDWEGLHWDEVEAQYPDAYRDYMADPGVNPYLGGESFGQVQERVVPAILSLVEKHLGESIAVVAHNTVNRAFLAHAMELSIGRAHQLPQKNGAINYIRFRNGKAKLVTINCVFHLDGHE